MYALLVLTKKWNVTDEDVHNAWAMHMNYKKRTATCFGHDHRSIVPFNELPKDVQEKDHEYTEALKSIALEMARELLHEAAHKRHLEKMAKTEE